MPKPRNDVIDRLMYLTLRLVSMLMHFWPVEINLKTARFFGRIWFHLDHRHRARARANLHNSFPDYTPLQCDEIACRSVQHIFMVGVEVLFTTRLIHINTWRRYVELEDFQKTLELLMDRHRGIIMLTGHYGNWEILGYTLATMGFDITSVARRLDNPHVSQWLFDVRERQGQKVIDKKGATSEITQTLGGGGAVAFVADQNAGSKGVFVDFFGRKASTYKSIGLLAMQYEVPVVIGFARRLGDRFRFQIGTQDIILPDQWKEQSDPLRYITQRYTQAIEDFIRADPTQYFWVHRRWKTRPKGETPQAYD